MVIQIAANAVTGKLFHADRQAKLLVSELLSYQVSGCEQMKSFKSGTWDGMSSFFDFNKETFPAGFVNPVISMLQKQGYVVQTLIKPLPGPLGPENPVVDANPYDSRYDYQQGAMEQLLKRGRMICQVATGGGKSRIAKLAYARINRQTLFLTTRSVLMYQMQRSFETDMGVKVGVIGDGNLTPVKGMNVGMVQTLASFIEEKTVAGEIDRLKANRLAAESREIKNFLESLDAQGLNRLEKIKLAERKTKELERQRKLSNSELRDEITRKVSSHNARREKIIKLLETFELVIGEEAHESGGNSYFEILKHCKNAHYRLALTATPFMRADAEDNMRLMACFGEIGVKVSEHDLISKGILAKPIFKFIPTQRPPKVFRTTGWQRAYQYGIVENEWRNKVIIYEAMRAAKHNLPVLLLVQHKKHGKVLQDALKKLGVVSKFIFGEHEQKERQAALDALKAGKIKVLIGSTILDVGVDVPALGVGILAGGGKAEVALRQRVGRVLRAKKTGPNIAFIIDFEDEHNSHLQSHARQRRAIIEGTKGFAENILPSGHDFDYSIFEAK